ncbi:MAG: hypothetical protein MJ252_19920, partial [archaeon]|nr:hypothetical protein [archaeon]
MQSTEPNINYPLSNDSRHMMNRFGSFTVDNSPYSHAEPMTNRTNGTQRTFNNNGTYMVPVNLIAFTARPENSNFSFEEYRVKDYQLLKEGKLPSQMNSLSLNQTPNSSGNEDNNSQQELVNDFRDAVRFRTNEFELGQINHLLPNNPPNSQTVPNQSSQNIFVPPPRDTMENNNQNNNSRRNGNRNQNSNNADESLAESLADVYTRLLRLLERRSNPLNQNEDRETMQRRERHVRRLLERVVNHERQNNSQGQTNNTNQRNTSNQQNPLRPNIFNQQTQNNQGNTQQPQNNQNVNQQWNNNIPQTNSIFGPQLNTQQNNSTQNQQRGFWGQPLRNVPNTQSSFSSFNPQNNLPNQTQTNQRQTNPQPQPNLHLNQSSLEDFFFPEPGDELVQMLINRFGGNVVTVENGVVTNFQSFPGQLQNPNNQSQPQRFVNQFPQNQPQRFTNPLQQNQPQNNNQQNRIPQNINQPQNTVPQNTVPVNQFQRTVPANQIPNAVPQNINQPQNTVPPMQPQNTVPPMQPQNTVPSIQNNTGNNSANVNPNTQNVSVPPKEDPIKKEQPEPEKDIPSLIRCYICSSIIKEPCICPYCSQPSCSECIKHWINIKNECPHCRQELNAGDLIKLNYINDVVSYINDLGKEKTKCPKHKDDFKYFCVNCHLLLCSDCLVFENTHSGHKIKKIEEIYEKEVEEIKQNEEGLNEQREILHKKISSINDKLSEIEIYKIKRGEELVEILNDLHSKIIRQSNVLEDKLKDTLKGFTEKVNEIDDAKNKIYKMMEKEAKAEFITKSKELKEYLSSVKEEIESSEILKKEINIDALKQMKTIFSSDYEMGCTEIEDFLEEKEENIQEEDIMMETMEQKGNKPIKNYFPIMNIYGLKWKLSLYPKGTKSEEFISVFIELLDDAPKDMKYYIKFELCNFKGNENYSNEFSTTFSEKNSPKGFEFFFKKNLLKEQGFIEEGTGKLRIKVFIKNKGYIELCRE